MRRPVIVADGYDPFNTSDLNDPTWPEFVRLVNEGRADRGMDPWILDWGDGGAPLEQQAEDFAEIARKVREWNGGRRGTVAVGISMGAVSLRYALAGADTLGVTRYLSINGPHRGAWINPDLLKFLRERAASVRSRDPGESSEAYLIRRGLGNPAAQALLIGGERHEAFYADLRSRGRAGYHPDIPRVAFSNGALVKEGNDLEELVEGRPGVVHRVSVKPLGLPLWLTVHKTRQSFRYGGFPGELLPESLRVPVRDHARFLGIFRLDFRARWETIPTFVPTHSALDFPDEVTGEARRYRYTQWRQSAFPTIYVSPYRNMAHDDREVTWTNPRSGRGAPEGWDAILYEISQGFRR